MGLLEHVLGTGVELQELKRKPGRRTTFRAAAGGRSAIVKLYASDRAASVAARVKAVADGPVEMRVPEVLAVDVDRHLVVLSELPGTPLRDPLLRGNSEECNRAGAALGAWHCHFLGLAPPGLLPHGTERELLLLREHAETAPAPFRRAVLRASARLEQSWDCRTAVHRDLYEEQVLLDERVGLIDLDDAALGPPELDVGNLAAQIDLLGLRARKELSPGLDSLLRGYERHGPALDGQLLEECRALSLLRLACIHRLPELIGRALARSAPPAGSRGAA